MNRTTSKRMIAAILLLACVSLFTFAQDKPAKPAQAPTPSATPESKKANERPPAAANAKGEPFEHATMAEMAAKCVRLETGAGVIEFELLPESAPETVRSFLNLVASGALDTTTFNRVVPGFVIQGGNLATRENVTAEVAARAARTIPDEPNNVQHLRGVVSMARPDTPNGATTQFFILIDSAPHLDGSFAAFGRVTKGMETVVAINSAPVEGEKPVKPVRLSHASLFDCTRTTPAQTDSIPPEE